MATVKKSKKMKIIVPICIVLVIAIASGSIWAYAEKKKVPTVSLATIATDSIIETVNATGTISSSTRREYSAGTIANCKEVFVKVGDKVKKGDKLATFNTDELDTQVTNLQITYNDARSAYNSAVKNQKDAKSKLNAANARIKLLEKQKAKLEKATANTKPASSTSRRSTTSPANTTSTTVTTTVAPVSKKNSNLMADPIIPGLSDATSQIDDIAQALTDLVTTINDLADDIETTNAITRTVMETIAEELATGQYSADAMADAIGKAIAESIQQGLIDETKLIIESGVAIDAIEAAVRNVNWSAIGKSIADDDNVQLTAVELQLAALYAERELFSVSASPNIVNTQKQIMNTSKSALDVLKKSQEELQAGWIASIDGVVTECNVEAGMQTSALQKGIVIENLGELSVVISLGEYDIHKVNLGMGATIKTAYGTYSGEIVSIAPTATGGNSSGSILDSVGSMAGISGLSSLTSKGAGVECVVKVFEPDDNIIAGFEASVEIKTGSYSGVPVVPIESIILEKEGTYVYKYDEEEGTVTKTKIETGATSDTAYEIVSGLSIGDKIVSTPASDYEEETFKVRVN